MKNLVFLSGDFSSGSTLLWTLFRQTGDFHCLYEPLHERLREFMIYPLRAYEHHFFSENYFREYKGYKEIFNLHKEKWGKNDFYLDEKSNSPDLLAYLHYIIGMSFSRKDNVVLQFNRVAFKLSWLKRNFPSVPIIEIVRDPDKQWNSIVKRSQNHHGREDVGQETVNFMGMGMANWCNQLQQYFPELRPENSNTGYERFLKLYNLSREQHNKYADLSIRFEDLTSNFEVEGKKIFDLVGYNDDIMHLKQFVIPPSEQKPIGSQTNAVKRKFFEKIDKAGFLYARLILRLMDLR